MLDFGNFHFYHYRFMVHWGIGPNLGQTGIALVWHPFYLDSTCLSGIVQDVLCFGKNLKNLQIFR